MLHTGRCSTWAKDKKKRYPGPKIFHKDVQQVFGFKVACTDIVLVVHENVCSCGDPSEVLWVDGSLVWNPLLPHDAFDGVWGSAHVVGNYYTVVTSTHGVDVQAQDLPKKSQFWKAFFFLESCAKPSEYMAKIG